MEDLQCAKSLVSSCRRCRGSGDSRVEFSSQCEPFGFSSLFAVSHFTSSSSHNSSSRLSRHFSEDKMRKRVKCSFWSTLPEFSSRNTHTSEIDISCCARVENLHTIPSQMNLLVRFSIFSHIGSEFAKTFILNKKIIFLLVVLVNILMAGSNPTHPVRHRHLRYILRPDQVCTKPGIQDQPTHEECTQPRVRRDVNAMSLREGQDASLCPYSVCSDEDPNRRPVHIHRVFCLQSGCRCTQEGSYRCTQLYNKVEVWYGANETQTQSMVRGTLEVEYGCVCAAKHGRSVESLVPDSVDK